MVLPETIIPRNISQELKTSYLNYAMSVIVSRALPDVRDGLKPVHRRILFAMYKVGMVFNRPHKKCATVVGEVLGKFHPHGEQAIYDALVRMAQEFSMGHVLINGQGNFGSMDGDNAAAMRYTECRLEKISEQMLKDIEKNTIDYQNTFDDSQKEPIVLPAAFPNLLVNGGSGIAVGMATNSPPHNLREVIDAIIYYINHQKESTIKDMMRFIKGPDFPTGAIIYGKEGIKKGYETGKGIFKIRAKVHIEPFRKDQEAIIITEIPYQINKAELIKKIAALTKNEVLKGITEIRDESDKQGVRVVIELKKNTFTQILINQLYKHTPLEDSFGINNVVLVDRSPQTLNLLEIISYFVAHRFEVETRRITFELKKAEVKAHILEGLIKAVSHIEEVIKIIRNNETVEKAKKDLISQFSFSNEQVVAILEMRLSRLVSLEIDKLNKDYKETKIFIQKCKDLLANKDKLFDLIKKDLLAIKDNYGKDRKTEIMDSLGENLKEEDFIEKETVVISLTKTGHVKRIPSETYKKQNRGGVGIKNLSTSNQENIVSLLFVATTHDTVMFITNLGKAYYVKIHEIPQASRIAKGTHIKMILNLRSDEEIQGYLTFKNFEQKKNFLMVTSKGIAKKCSVNDFVNAKKRGIQAINLKNGDTIVSTVEIQKEDDLMIFSKKGLAIRTKESNFRKMGRNSGGVIGINLSTKDNVIGIQKVDNNKSLLLISEKGLGKKLNFSEFSAKGRAGKGQICMKTNNKTGNIAAIASVREDENILAITSKGNIIRMDSNDISKLGRQAKGPKLVNVKEGDVVIDIAVIQEIEQP